MSTWFFFFFCYNVNLLFCVHFMCSFLYLFSVSASGKVNEVYAQYFTKELPARSCVAVKELPKSALVEIEVIAVVK